MNKKIKNESYDFVNSSLYDEKKKSFFKLSKKKIKI